MAFEANVFVNCPFDKRYRPLLRPLLFTIIYLQLRPRIALEAIDSGEMRLEKIVRLVRKSKFAIHDLSRAQAAKAGELYRLNMPFELGVDYGCRRFGTARQKGKQTLVLEAEPHRYKAALSDLAGADGACHHNDPYKIIGAVRDWLRNCCLDEAAPPARIASAFSDFMAENFDRLTARGFSKKDIAELQVFELMGYMESWVADNVSRA